MRLKLCFSQWASLLAQTVKNLPAIRETQVGSLDWEDSAGEGNGNPLQSSCLDNPMDGGACWAAVYGVAQSRTRVKRLSSSSSSSGSSSSKEALLLLSARKALVQSS